MLLLYTSTTSTGDYMEHEYYKKAWERALTLTSKQCTQKGWDHAIYVLREHGWDEAADFLQKKGVQDESSEDNKV